MFDLISFVAIDIETTGLDPERDRITEIAAVRFAANGDEMAVFETLVNPGREIPYFVSKLTGLSDEMVRGAPAIAGVAGEIEAFLGGSVVVGHNLGFDLGYLRREGIDLARVTALDTAELARLLLAGAGPAGLADVARELGIEIGEHHRALPDARAAGRVFLELNRRLDALPEATRADLAGVVAVRDTALAALVGGETWQSGAPSAHALPLPRPAPDYPALARREPALPISADEVRAVFAAAGPVFEAFEERPEQIEMAEAVQSAMSDGGHWMIEAGTGVGKSLAYLVPAALHALRNGERVVVSTNTINLQEQLLAKDIPALRRMLKAAGVIAEEGELRASVLKGRSNYLCVRRFFAGYGASLGDPDFAELASSLLLWLPDTETGDRSELRLGPREAATWQRLSAQDTDCLAKPNRFVRDGQCFLVRARKAAESAHILIVNHALLLADLATGGSALPPFDHLVVDEAHNLEETATRQFGGSVSRRLLADALEGLHRRGSRESREGGVAALLKGFPETSVKAAGKALEEAVARAQGMLLPAFSTLLREVPRGEDDRLLVAPAVRARESWTAAELAWGELDRALREALTAAAGAARAVAATAAAEEGDVLAGEIDSATRRVEELRAFFADLMKAAGDETIAWLARENDDTASFHSAPLDVGPRLWEELFAKRRTVVATSATLSAGGSMEYAIRRLGLETPKTLQLGSPFDYRRAALLTSFTDIPEPNDAGYSDAVARAVSELVAASGGRALALFTSHAAIRQVYPRVRDALAAEGITVVAQGIDGTPKRLIDLLKEQLRTLVLGTQSFWEGVDVRGEALSLLIIARLPFAVPTDPVQRARSEQYDSPFGQYSLPAAILRFRQGFGRLIRDKNDRGVVAVLDRRIWEKSYGARFVASVPDCTKLRGGIGDVAESVREWLGR